MTKNPKKKERGKAGDARKQRASRLYASFAKEQTISIYIYVYTYIYIDIYREREGKRKRISEITVIKGGGEMQQETKTTVSLSSKQ